MYVLTRVNDAGTVSATAPHLQIQQSTDTGTNSVTLQDFKDGQLGIYLGQQQVLGDVEGAGASVDYYYVSATPFANGNVLVTYNNGGNLYGKILDADGKTVADVPGTLPMREGAPTASLRNGNIMIMGSGEVSVIASDGSIVVDKKAIALEGSLSWDGLACRTDGKVAVSHGDAISLLDQTGNLPVANDNLISLLRIA